MNAHRVLARIIEAWNQDINSQDFELRIPAKEMQGSKEPFFELKHRNSNNYYTVQIRKQDPRESDLSL